MSCVDLTFVDEFSRRWAAAWASHQPEQVLELMTEDISCHDSAWPTTMHAHDEVRAFLEAIWTAIPDLTFEVVDGPILHPSAARVCFQWRASGTNAGPLNPPGYAATGRRVDFHGFRYQEYRGDLVCRLWAVFDTGDLARQLGLLPSAGSRTERALAAAQRGSMRWRRGGGQRPGL
jgi:steroid delta-isomerase-like uncharacterized protein